MSLQTINPSQIIDVFPQSGIRIRKYITKCYGIEVFKKIRNNELSVYYKNSKLNGNLKDCRVFNITDIEIKSENSYYPVDEDMFETSGAIPIISNTIKSDINKIINFKNEILYMDCIEGMKTKIESESIDHFFADPPFGIDFTKIEGMYNRKKSFVINGYAEPISYKDFTVQWINECYRVLKKEGTGFICSGWSNLEDILYAIRNSGFKLVNHIIWHYNFGVYTKNKFVTSHYHILFVAKGLNWGFNKDCRFPDVRNKNGNLNYRDREDVWNINRPYRRGEEKNANTQPIELVEKALVYTANKGDLILDPFMGGGTTAVVAKSLGMDYIGFEINSEMKKLHDMRLKDAIAI